MQNNNNRLATVLVASIAVLLVLVMRPASGGGSEGGTAMASGPVPVTVVAGARVAGDLICRLWSNGAVDLTSYSYPGPQCDESFVSCSVYNTRPSNV